MFEGLKQRLSGFFPGKNLRTAGLFALGGAVAGVLIGLYMEAALGDLLPPEELEEFLATMPQSDILMALLGAAQVGVITFITALIGIRVAQALGLRLSILESLANRKPIPSVSRDGAKYAVLLGLIVAFIIVVADRFYFQARIPTLAGTSPSFSLIGLLSGIFYGGIVEEVLLRLFLMSILLWIASRLFVRKDLKQIPNGVYWAVIIIVALLFAALHLPNTSLLLGELTGILLLRIMLLNTIGGVVYGWLFWKYGIEYAIVSHMMSHIGMQLVFIPIFF